MGSLVGGRLWGDQPAYMLLGSQLRNRCTRHSFVIFSPLRFPGPITLLHGGGSFGSGSPGTDIILRVFLISVQLCFPEPMTLLG